MRKKERGEDEGRETEKERERQTEREQRNYFFYRAASCPPLSCWAAAAAVPVMKCSPWRGREGGRRGVLAAFWHRAII